jgi:acyl-coenzyme A thioesterase PaaI-like protein
VNEPHPQREERAPHFLSDLDITTEQVTATRSISVAPVVDAVRDRAGAASLGFLSAVVDVNCALVALIAADPDWTATADLTLHGVEPLTVGPVVVESRLLRAGRNVIVVSVVVCDGRGVDPLAEGRARPVGALADAALATAASGLLTFARIPRGASLAAATFDPRGAVGTRRSLSPVEAVPVVGLTDRIGLRVLDASRGAVELTITEYVRNSFGAINGGVLGMVVQGAAEAALPAFVATDVQVHYLAQARVGPVRTTTIVLRDAGDHAVCTVEVVDAGDDDTQLALASVTLQRPAAVPTGSLP